MEIIKMINLVCVEHLKMKKKKPSHELLTIQPQQQHHIPKRMVKSHQIENPC